MSTIWVKNRREIFWAANKLHPDLMEPWVTRLGDLADDVEAEMRLMREALAATFRQRYPMPNGEAWPEPALPREVTVA